MARASYLNPCNTTPTLSEKRCKTATIKFINRLLLKKKEDRVDSLDTSTVTARSRRLRLHPDEPEIVQHMFDMAHYWLPSVIVRGHLRSHPGSPLLTIFSPLPARGSTSVPEPAHPLGLVPAACSLAGPIIRPASPWTFSLPIVDDYTAGLTPATAVTYA